MDTQNKTQREIKFRAWDIFYKKFIYSGEEEGALSNFFAKVAGGESAGREVPLMQFTGLHDKNGKEIYEGDVLKGSGDFSARAIVEWEGGGFHGVGGYKHMGHSFFKDMEIIGNIYENPDLLTPNTKE